MLMAPMAASAEQDQIYTTSRSNVAAGGYDVVTFFSGTPQEGAAEFSTTYDGAEWYFLTEANKASFIANPDKFAPQYGGYCAWAMSKGKFAAGKPKHWNVEDGRLFFNYNARIKRKWEKMREEFIIKADAQWTGVKPN